MGKMPYETGEPYVAKKNRNKAPDDTPRIYTQAEVDGILEQRDEQRGRQREDSQRRSNEDDESSNINVGIDPKLIRQLQATVSVFNTLKEFASSPLQKAIEGRVGELAAGVVEQSFKQPSSGGKKDLLDLILNSQLAYGFGHGLGEKSPELVEALGRTVGKEKTDRFVDNMLDQYGKGPGQGPGSSQGRGQGPSPGRPNSSGSGSSPAGITGPGSENIELLLSLDANNSEHVAAYAESQGGIRVETARKMLMMHQDEMIEQMRLKGLDVSGFGQIRRTDNGRNVQEEETARLKREQQEMLSIKRQLDQQLQENQEKVVSYKDIHTKTETVKPKIVEEVAKIPDKWDESDLNEDESKSIRKAELARQANARNNSVKETTDANRIKETNDANGINDVNEIGEKDIVHEAPVLVPVPEEDTVPIIVPIPEEDTVPIMVPVPIEKTRQRGEHDIKDDKKYKFRVIYSMLTKILLDDNGKETPVRSSANEEEILAYEKKHGVKIH